MTEEDLEKVRRLAAEAKTGTELGMLERSIEAAARWETLLRRIAALLERVEWAHQPGYNDLVWCPFCVSKSWDGHSPDCELAAVRAELAKLLDAQP